MFNVSQICSICGVYYQGYGNNAQPINDGRCCDRCEALVSYRRINDAYGHDMPVSLLDELQGLQQALEQGRLEARRLAARSKN